MNMRTIATLAGLLFAATSVAAQSLADVARAEQERRKAVTKPSKVYTNNDLGSRGDSPAPPPSSAASASGDTPAAKAPEPQPAEASGTKDTRDEKYWRTRIADARTALQRSQGFVEALQSQINALTTEFVNMDDPARRAVIEKKRIAAITEQDRLKGEIEAQTKAIAAIEDEARRAGVPPGWLR